MSELILQIDGKEVRAQEGMTLLEAARKADISIPTLCYHEKLEPFGGCRLCIVEVESRGSSRLVVSCVYPAEKGINVKTRSEKIDRIRKMILECSSLMRPMPSCFRTWQRSMGRTRTVSKRSLPSVSIAASASGTVPRSRRRTPSASWTGA